MQADSLARPESTPSHRLHHCTNTERAEALDSIISSIGAIDSLRPGSSPGFVMRIHATFSLKLYLCESHLRNARLLLLHDLLP